MRLTSVVSGVALVVALALAGCGGDDGSDGDSGSDDAPNASSTEGSDEEDDSGDDGPLDVCALVSAEDLQELFGSPFDPGELVHHDQTGGDQCTWSNTDAPPVKVISLTVLREGHLSEMFTANDYSLEDLFEETKGYATDVEELDLGDQAYRAGSQVSVLDGDAMYDFSVTGTSPEAIAGLKRFAELVIG